MLTQTSIAYLYPSKIPVYIFEDMASIKQRYRIVYARTLKLYRGIDNLLQFTVLNQEQKPVDLRTSIGIDNIVMSQGGQGLRYSVGDMLTVKGGDAVTPAIIEVLAVDPIQGKITDYALHTPGIYTRTPKIENNKVLGGSGSGAAFNLFADTLETLIVEFNLLRDDDNSVFHSVPVTIVDAEKGIVEITIAEGELDLIKHMRCYYSLAYRKNIIDPYRSMYVNDNFDARGELQILAGHYPTHEPSVLLQLIGPTHLTADPFYPAGGPLVPPGAVYYVASPLIMDAKYKRSNTLHTAQFNFGNGFTGAIKIRATQDPIALVNGNTSTGTWAVVGIYEFEDQVNSTYVNLEGVFTAIRFDVLHLNGSVPKIYYRN